MSYGLLLAYAGLFAAVALVFNARFRSHAELQGKRTAAGLWLIGLFALGAFALCPFIGMEPVAFSVLWRPQGEDIDAIVFWKTRAPRVCTAFLAGSALAIGGMAFQALFRNPLATPFTLGVSSGASLGVAFSLRTGLVFSAYGFSSLSLSAFVGALVAIFLVYGLTRLKRGFSTATMLLAGVAVSFFFSSLILFIQYTADIYDSFRLLRWLMGGLAAMTDFRDFLNAAPFVVVGGLVVIFFTHELNLVTIGDDLAMSRGVDVVAVKRWLFLATSLMVGGVVSVCGPIAFVGMMAPHICRLLIGADHRVLAPASLLFGGGFLAICDTLARTVLAPAELPVGVITAFLGGPFFLWLLTSGNADRQLR